MELLTDIEQQVARLRDLFGDDVSVDGLAGRMEAFGSAQLVEALKSAAAVVRCAERISIVGAGLAAQRSTREAGQDGLAQSRGHRTAAALIQELTGVSYGEAQRQVRLGQAILEAASARYRAGGADAEGAGFRGRGDGDDQASGDGFWSWGSGDEDAADRRGHDGSDGTGAEDDSRTDTSGPDGHEGDAGPDGHESDTGAGGGDGEGESSARPRAPWHEPLSRAMMQGRISPAQQDAIQRGLGRPADDTDDTHAAWQAAAEQLIDDAAERTVEELRVQARAIRDQLDPEGAKRRFQERYERRSFRTWVDADGRQRGHIEFEDDGAAWMRAIRDAALRPRRGGPRFVDSDEARRAEDLTADSRTNDQLFYDLLLDLLRAGSLADAKDVFGTRQAGVRIVQVQNSAGAPTSAHTEDYGFPVPFASVQQRVCETGITPVTVDPHGNPLNVGREHRLFTPSQRVALAIRDGGCRWRGCDRPASYCEAHHIDEWHADTGRTDIDRGILLCRHHHMQLHHNGWRIARNGTDDFHLYPPGSRPPIPLHPRAALVAAWAGIDPPPKRFSTAA